MNKPTKDLVTSLMHALETQFELSNERKDIIDEMVHGFLKIRLLRSDGEGVDFDEIADHDEIYGICSDAISAANEHEIDHQE